MGAEIFTCMRTIEPTFAAVMREGAMFALLRALLPPKVRQSACAVVSELAVLAAEGVPEVRAGASAGGEPVVAQAASNAQVERSP
jgi:hypothetical protein